MKKSTDENLLIDKVAVATTIPDHGVMVLDRALLGQAGVLMKFEHNKIHLWADPHCNTNTEYSECCEALVQAAGYDAIEASIMFEAINKAELSIRLIGILSNK